MKTQTDITSVIDDQPEYRRLVDEIKDNKANCQHCGREIVRQIDGAWIDPQATGDDSIWSETCDQHDTFTAEHEPPEQMTPTKACEIIKAEMDALKRQKPSLPKCQMQRLGLRFDWNIIYEALAQ